MVGLLDGTGALDVPRDGILSAFLHIILDIQGIGIDMGDIGAVNCAGDSIGGGVDAVLYGITL